MSVTIRAPHERDFFAWLGLYGSYTDFYDTELTDEKALVLWSWLSSADHEENGLVAVDDEGELVGLAHFRRFPRPLKGDHGYFLDDLFVAAQSRNQGIGESLIDAVHAHAAENGGSVVRWVTAPDNDEARRLYDRVAEATPWVTYEQTI